MLTLSRTARTAAIATIAAALVPVAKQLGAEAEPYDGVTVADLRTEAVKLGILSGREKGRELSFLGGVMKRAGLVPTALYKRSSIAQSHGNLHRVWRAPAA